MKRTKILIAVLSSACLLSACHKSPLKTHNKRKDIQFLIEASHAAGKKLSLTSPTGSYAYSDCMLNKGDLSNCTSLIKAMVQYAKISPLIEFKGITFADLNDKEFFKGIEEDYEETLFYTLAEDK